MPTVASDDNLEKKIDNVKFGILCPHCNKEYGVGYSDIAKGVDGVRGMLLLNAFYEKQNFTPFLKVEIDGIVDSAKEFLKNRKQNNVSIQKNRNV